MHVCINILCCAIGNRVDERRVRLSLTINKLLNFQIICLFTSVQELVQISVECCACWILHELVRHGWAKWTFLTTCMFGAPAENVVCSSCWFLKLFTERNTPPSRKAQLVFL